MKRAMVATMLLFFVWSECGAEQKRRVLNFWGSLLCLVIAFGRTLIVVRSYVSAEVLKALVFSSQIAMWNTGHVLCSGQGDDDGDVST